MASVLALAQSDDGSGSIDGIVSYSDSRMEEVTTSHWVNLFRAL